MSNQRKQIIINEIAFWKQNKMLPPHYCDFLTSLYTGGQPEEGDIVGKPKESIIAKEKKTTLRKYIVFPILAVLSIVLLNFVPIDWIGISIGLTFGVILAVFGIKLAIKKHLAAPIIHVSSALLILAMTVKLAITYFDGNNNVLFAILSFNSLLWFVLGIWQKLIYFTLAGGISLLLVVGYMFFI